MKTYIGDSVYADLERGMIKLTTENGSGPSNEIYLEPEVVENLLKYIAYINKKQYEDIVDTSKINETL